MVEELAKKPEPVGARGVGRPSQEDEVTIEAAMKAATIGFASLNMTIVSLFGVECAATSAEREVAIESLQGMLEGMSVETAERVSKLLLPFQLASVFASWGTRIYRIKKEEAEDQGGPGPGSTPAPEVPPAGGNHREKTPEPTTPLEPELEPVEQIGPDGKPVKFIPIDALRRADGAGLDSRS